MERKLSHGGSLMLVLSRKRGETIMIGDKIEISVVDIRGNKVRIGITAPTKISVHRKEVYEAVKAENMRPSQSGAEKVDQQPNQGTPTTHRLRSPGSKNPHPHNDETEGRKVG